MAEHHVHAAGESHDHPHDTGHPASHAGHSHAPASFSTAFAVGTALNLAFVIAELVYGLRSQSLALVADAGHNFSDVLGLLLAWAAAGLAARFPTPKLTACGAFPFLPPWPTRCCS